MTAANSAAWFSVADAADEIGVTTRTIYRLINDGALSAYRLGRVFRIRTTDLASYLESARIKPGDLDHLLGIDPDDS